MGGDHDLVGREVAQRVLERRVGLVVIAHISARPEPGGRHRRERGIEALAGIIERLVNVGRPMLERRARERRDHDQDLAVAALHSILDLSQQRPAAHGLIREDEHAVDRIVAVRDLRLVRQGAHRAAP